MKPDPDFSVSHALIQVCKAHRNRAQTALAALGLHAGQEMILFALFEEEGVPQSQLVEQLCVEPPTVTKMVQRLEHAGLVERRADTEDARVSRVYLTAEGRSLEMSVRRVWAELEAQTVAGLSDVEQVLLRRILVQIQANLTEEDN